MKKILKRLAGYTMTIIITISFVANIALWLAIMTSLTVREDLLAHKGSLIGIMCLNLPILLFSLYCWFGPNGSEKIEKLIKTE